MKKYLSMMAIGVIAIMGTSAAQAKVSTPLWACSLDARNVNGSNIGIGISAGGFESADATIRCTQPGEKTKVMKGAIIVRQIGVGIGISVYKSFHIRSLVTGLVNANNLYGEYRFGVKSGINLVNVEGGILTSATFDQGLSIELALYGAEAYGLAVNAQAMSLSIMTHKEYKKLKQQLEEQRLNRESTSN